MGRRRLSAVALAAVLLLSACSGDDDDGGDAATVVPPSSTTAVAQTSTTSSPTTVASTSAPSTSTSTSTSSTSTSTTSTSATTVATSATISPRDLLVFQPQGLGVAAFGDDPDTAIAAISAVVGAPSTDSGWVDPFSQFGTCPGTAVRGVAWGDLLVLFGDASWVMQGPRHLFAYHYGPPTGQVLVPPGLRTDRNLTVGASVAELRAAYPDVQVLPGEQGIAPPSFYVSEALAGFLTGTTVTDSVTSILGGVGCGD